MSGTGNEFQLGIRLREGPDKGTLEWRRPNRMTLQTLLHNPAYAGIYAYGRRRVDPRRQDPARPSTGRVVRSRDGWHVMIPDVLPAYYITVAQFEANEAKLAANRARAEAMGAVRDGPALAAGLVHCGRCNRRMSVRYHTQRGRALPECLCSRDVTNYGADKTCQLLNSACVDALVEQQVLAALAPAAVEVSLRAADQVVAERAELEQLWSQWLERAAHDADRARRSHHLAEPENRLVVAPLQQELAKLLAKFQKDRSDIVSWQEESNAAGERISQLINLVEMANRRLQDLPLDRQRELMVLIEAEATITGDVPQGRKGQPCALAAWFSERELDVPVLTDEGWERVVPLVDWKLRNLAPRTVLAGTPLQGAD